jgi:hypothetical protein
MNVAATLTAMGIGAAIGGVSGFMKGRNPADDMLAPRPTVSLSPSDTAGASMGPADPAFAPLYQ